MASASRVLLHIGYHKTGTTWLQTLVFPRHPELVLFPDRQLLSDLFVAVDQFDFDACATRERLEPAIADGRVTVISSERLAGHPDSAGFDSRVIADRLHATFGEARVLVVIRDQPEMVRSAYVQYVRSGGTESLQRWLRKPRGWRRMPHFDLAYLQYDRLIRYYQSLFGRDQVLVLCFEQLRSDPVEFVSIITDFVGVTPFERLETAPVNTSLCPATLLAERWANRVLARDAVNPGALVDHEGLANFVSRAFNRIDRYLPDALRALGTGRYLRTIDAACRGRFAESNRRTAELTGLPLARFGYEI